jgi:N4-gp56 family major capsid protein
MADSFVTSATNSGATIKTAQAVSTSYAAGGSGEGYDNLVQRAYDRMVEFALRSEPMFRNLADKRPVQQAMPGYAVTFSLYNDLAKATTPLSEESDVDAAALDDVDTVSVVLKEYGNVVVNTRYSRETAFADIDPAIGNILAFNMADSIDSIVANVLNSTSNTLTGEGSAGEIDGVEIRKAVAKLRGANVVPRDGSLYTAMIHPDVGFDLRNASGPNAFEDVRKYTGAEPVLNQTIGVYGGAAIVETPRCPVATDAVDGDDYSAFILGRQALAEAVSVEARTVLGPVVDRLERFRPLGWHMIAGWNLFRSEAMYKISTKSTIAVNP